MKISRRDFVKHTSLAIAASAFAESQTSNRLPMAFSTLGCPQWDLPYILNFAERHGFAAIELRGLQGSLDLPTHAAFSDKSIAQTKRDIAAHGLRIACVSSSANMQQPDQAKRKHEIDDAQRFIDLAESLNAPYVRVFGKSDDSDHPVVPNDAAKQQVAAGLAELAEYSGPKGVTVLIESHDDFTSSATLSDVLNRANSHHVGLLWDAYHTFDGSNEAPEESVRQLGRWICHTHLKDAVGRGNGRRYVLTGRGNIPIKRQIDALQSSGYKGYFCFEWEKVWHPELEDPEIAIADFARVVSGYLKHGA